MPSGRVASGRKQRASGIAGIVRKITRAPGAVKKSIDPPRLLSVRERRFATTYLNSITAAAAELQSYTFSCPPEMPTNRRMARSTADTKGADDETKRVDDD